MVEKPSPCYEDEYAPPQRVTTQARYNVTCGRWELVEFDVVFSDALNDRQIVVVPELATVVARDVTAQVLNTLYNASAADWIFDWDSEGCVEIVNALVESVATAIAGNFERTEKNTNPYCYYESEDEEEEDGEGE